MILIIQILTLSIGCLIGIGFLIIILNIEHKLECHCPNTVQSHICMIKFC